MIHTLRHSLTARLMLLFALLLVFFTLMLGVLYNALLERQLVSQYSLTMQRNAYAISQNLSELIAPSAYEGLDETPFPVEEDMLAPYLALMEHITHCNVYVIDVEHNVTGYFDGVVQTMDNPLLPGYIEQTIALGFMGKTPFIKARVEDDTHLTACMPIMNAHSQVLGVVLLETTLREMGFAQVPSTTILLTSCAISFALAVLLAFLLSRSFTRPISTVQRVAGALASGRYEVRTHLKKNDEIGSLARSMDILATRLEEAREKDEQLRKQQQEFFSIISHELRTPVTIIRGSLEALRDGVIASGQDIKASCTRMIAESCWLQRLIQDLLELSRLQSTGFSLDTTRVDLSELLGDVAMSAGTLCAQKGVLLDGQEPETAFCMQGDYARLRQMLLTVIDNAVKFTPPGKTVRLSMQRDAPVIRIADEGDGIAPEEIAHIFDRFHRTHDASRDGTGLGLAIASEIARRHGVRIDVASRRNEGTVFTFTFPAQPREALP